MRSSSSTNAPSRLRTSPAAIVVLAGITCLAASTSRASLEVGRAEMNGGLLELRAVATCSEEALFFDGRAGRAVVRLAGAGVVRDAGKPLLPVETLRIALPDGMTVTGIRLVDANLRELPGEHSIAPAGSPTPLAGAASAGEAPVRDPAVYRSAAPFPAERIAFVGQTDLAGQGVAVIRVFPLQYFPADGKLVLATSLEFALEGVPGHVCGDYLPAGATIRARRTYERMLTQAVANPEDVSLRADPGAGAPRRLDSGVCEYVIITDLSWADDFLPLAEWRTRKGSPAKIVTTAWIYNLGGYSGTNLEKIRAFVIDAHANWGATHFLLGGDSNTIPDDTRQIEVPGYGVHDLANDTYFADYDDDWVCEVHVGRASVRTEQDIAAFIDKVFTYEKDPPADYATTAAFFGFDISEPGDGHGEISKEHIRGLHLPVTWTLRTEYDSEPGSHRADVIGYLNQGHHLVNHHDHCNETSMGAGWISHADLLYTADIDALTNGDRQSIVFAVGCHPCNVPYYRTIGEACVLNPNGGAVAFMGNSGWGWGGSIEDPDWYTARQDRFFYRNLFDDGFEKLGENFSDLKNDEFDFDDPYNLHRFCFIQLHLLGDPEMPVWSDTPKALEVTHGDTVYLGPGTFVVHAESGGSPVDGALVCLWKDGDVYEVAETASGDAVFALAPASPGTLLVTVSHRNHVPHEGEAVVAYDPTSVESDGPGARARLSLVSVLPNPFGATTEITYSVPAAAARVRVDVYNCRGQRVRTLVDGGREPGTYREIWDGTDGRGLTVASGIYFCEIRSGTERDTRKVALVR